MKRFEGFSEQEVSNDMIASFNTLKDVYDELSDCSIGDLIENRYAHLSRIEDVLKYIGKYVSADETIKELK